MNGIEEERENVNKGSWKKEGKMEFKNMDEQMEGTRKIHRDEMNLHIAIIM